MRWWLGKTRSSTTWSIITTDLGSILRNTIWWMNLLRRKVDCSFTRICPVTMLWSCRRSRRYLPNQRLQLLKSRRRWVGTSFLLIVTPAMLQCAARKAIAVLTNSQKDTFLTSWSVVAPKTAKLTGQNIQIKTRRRETISPSLWSKQEETIIPQVRGRTLHQPSILAK